MAQTHSDSMRAGIAARVVKRPQEAISRRLERPSRPVVVRLRGIEGGKPVNFIDRRPRAPAREPFLFSDNHRARPSCRAIRRHRPGHLPRYGGEQGALPLALHHRFTTTPPARGLVEAGGP